MYNRYGQIVFTTKEPGLGWNGQVGGHSADANVFVWNCIYQFEGEAAHSEKGTVILVK